MPVLCEVSDLQPYLTQVSHHVTSQTGLNHVYALKRDLHRLLQEMVLTHEISLLSLY